MLVTTNEFRSVLYKFHPVPPKEDGKKNLKKDIAVLLGNDIILPIYFEGFPSPTVTWTLNEIKLSPSDRIILEERGRFTKVTIKRAKTTDAGTYKVILCNSVGEAKISSRVSVHGNGLL